MIWFPPLTRFLLITSTKYIKTKYVFICPTCISSSCFMLFTFVCPWHCECVIKCPYLAWMQHNFFRTHLKWFWNAFQKVEICWKALTKGETLNSCELTFQAYCYNDIFKWKWTEIQCGLKSSIMKEIGQIPTLQTRYLVRKFLLFFLHVVFIKVYMFYLQGYYNLIILWGSHTPIPRYFFKIW